MAFMSQENKKKIQAELKHIIPANWKWSLSVHNHTSLCLTITRADIDLFTEHSALPENKGSSIQVNEHYLSAQFKGEALAIMEDIKSAMMHGNHDRSDSQVDYFDVGWYISINIGTFQRPFVYAPSNRAPYVPQAAKSAPVTTAPTFIKALPVSILTATQVMRQVLALGIRPAQA